MRTAKTQSSGVFKIFLDGQLSATQNGSASPEEDCVIGFVAHGLVDADHLLQVVVEGPSNTGNDTKGQKTGFYLDSITWVPSFSLSLWRRIVILD